MDSALKQAHGAGYLFLIGFLFVVSTLVNGGCGLIPQTPYIADAEYTFDDGTSVVRGEPVYLDAAGRATASDKAADGAPNKPLMVTDVAKLEKLKETSEKTAGSLPPPFGWIAALGIGVIGAGGIAAARKLNAKKLADAGAKKKA